VSHRTWNQSKDSYYNKNSLDLQLLPLNQHFNSMITVVVIITISIKPPIFLVRYQNKSHREEQQQQQIKDNYRSISKAHPYRDSKSNRNSAPQWYQLFQVLLASTRVSCRIKRVTDRFSLEILKYRKSLVGTMECIYLCLCRSCLMQGVHIM